MYGNITDFKAYCDAAGYDYSAYTDTQITYTLELSSKKLDSEYRPRWIGGRADINQELEWPRKNAIGSHTGRTYPSDSVPSEVINSTYEIAFQVLDGVVRGVVSTSPGATVKSEKKSLVSGMFKEVEYTSGLSPEDQENQVFDTIAELYLFDLLLRGSSGGFTTCKKL